MHAIEIAGGGNVDLIVTSDGVHRAFANNLTSLKRFPTTIDLKGGYKELDVAAGGGSVPLVWDRDCPASSAYFLNKKHLLRTEAFYERYGGKTIIIAPQKDNSLRSLQVRSPQLTSESVTGYTRELLKQKEIIDFLEQQANI